MNKYTVGVGSEVLYQDEKGVREGVIKSLGYEGGAWSAIVFFRNTNPSGTPQRKYVKVADLMLKPTL